MRLHDYPCPECGSDGPHAVIETTDDGQRTAECGECFAEFTVHVIEEDADHEPVTYVDRLRALRPGAADQIRALKEGPL